MKRYLYILLGILLVTSCLEDKGNYNYIPVKEVKINNLPTNTNAILYELFELTPELVTDIPETDFEYLWYVGTDTLSREKVLSYTFKNLQLNAQHLYFEARDKTNNVRYCQKMNLNIVTNFRSGWLILSELAEKGYFSFLSYEGKGQLYTDMFQQVKGESLGSDPQMISHVSDYSGQTNRIAIICKGGNSAEIDGNSFDFIKYYKDEFRAADFAPELIDIEAPINFSSTPGFYILSSGKIYCKGGNKYDEGWYEYPLESSDNKGYEADNQIGAGYSCYLTFDRQNGRYLTFRNNGNTFSSLAPIPILEGSTPVFNPSEVQGRCLWIGVGGSPNSDYLSIIQTPDDRYLLHILRATTNTTTWVLEWRAIAEYEFTPGQVNEQSRFAVNTTIPYLYIGTGKQVSVLNLNAAESKDQQNTFIPLKNYEGDITAMKYYYYNDYNTNKATEELVLGIKTSAQPLAGSLVFISPDPTKFGEILKTRDQVGGKIVSLFYKQK